MSQNNITTLSYAINSNNRSVLIIMLNHLQCNILMYYENFSKGHKGRDNPCPSLSSPLSKSDSQTHQKWHLTNDWLAC